MKVMYVPSKGSTLDRQWESSMERITNLSELVSKGNQAGRRIALDIINHAISKMDAFEAVRRLVKVQNSLLTIGDKLDYDLDNIGNIYVVGAGKATFPMALALDKILGNRIKRGVVIVKRGQISKQQTKPGHIEVLEASHPIPDASGFKATKQIWEIAELAGRGDIVFSLVSGGASALMPMPAEGISLGDEIATTKLLLNLGISVEEINCVRNHISSVKGGRLAQRIHPAELVNFIIIDQPESVPWGPTVPDTTTAKEAIEVLKRYKIWLKVPKRVRAYLIKASKDPSLDTPKRADFKKIRYHTLILGENSSICKEAELRARKLGLETMLLTSVLEGESKDAGTVLGSIAREIESNNSSRIRAPCALIAGGETTVKITKATNGGLGGPSQELVLSAAVKIAGSKKIVIASIDTDGTDGFSDAAGGIADGYTKERAWKKGIDLQMELLSHNSSFVLRSLGDAIKTGMTGTNVMDLNIIVVTK
jgi:glycerate 2-kinase